MVAAVHPRLLRLTHQIILRQELPRHGDIKMLPGEQLVNPPLAMSEESGVQSLGGEGIQPGAFAEMFAPGVEFRPVPPGALHHFRHPPVAPAEKAFVKRFTRIIPAQAQAMHPHHLVLQQLQLGVDRLLVVHRLPLEGGVRLGDEGADAHVDARLLAVQLTPLGQHRFG